MPRMEVQINKRATMTKPKRGSISLSGELRMVNLELIEKHYIKKPKPPYRMLVVSEAPDLVLRDICKRLQNITANSDRYKHSLIA